MERFDAIVIGAGVAGSAAARELAADARVLLLEAREFGHARGSSHGGSRIFRHAYEHVDDVRLAVEAEALWRELEREADERLLHRCGGLDLDAAGSPELARIEAALRAAGRPVERLGAAEVGRRYPAFRPAEDEVALYSPDAAVLPASRCVAVLQRVAAERGATLRAGEPVRALRPGTDGVEVVTSAGRYGAERVVLTAGAWLTEGPLALALPLHVEAQQVVYAGLEPGAAPAFSRARCPVFIHRGSGVYGFPLFERPDAVKISDHEGAPRVRLAERRDAVDPARAAATLARARRLLPGLSGRVVGGETCLYTKTPDRDFLLGPHPEAPGVVVGGGFSGHGFKFGPLLGRLLAAAARGEAGAVPARFAPTRFASGTTSR